MVVVCETIKKEQYVSAYQHVIFIITVSFQYLLRYFAELHLSVPIQAQRS